MANILAGLTAMLPGATPVNTGEQTPDVTDPGLAGVPIPGATGPADLGTQDQMQAIWRRLGGMNMPSTTMPAIPTPHPGRLPRIPASVAAPVSKKGTGEGGGMNLDTIMPILLLAAPFLEMARPGYGVGLAQGVLGYQAQQKETRQKTIFGLAQDFSKVSPDQKNVMQAAFKNAGIAPDVFEAAWQLGQATRDPHAEMERKLQEVLGPYLQEERLTGRKLDPTQLPPDVVRAAHVAGGLPSYDVQQGVTGMTPGMPAGTAPPAAGGFLREAPATAPQPVMGEQVVERGARPAMTLGILYGDKVPAMLQNVPVKDPREWEDYATKAGWITTLADREKVDERARTQLLDDVVTAVGDPKNADIASLQARAKDLGLSWSTLVRKSFDLNAKESKERLENSVEMVQLLNGKIMPMSHTEALSYLEKNDGMVIKRLPDGTTVKLTGKEYANVLSTQERLRIEWKNLAVRESEAGTAAGRLRLEQGINPVLATVNGVQIRSEAGLKGLVYSGVVPLTSLPAITQQWISKGLNAQSNPTLFNQAVHEGRKVQAAYNQFQTGINLFQDPKLQAAIQHYVAGTKLTDGELKLLTGDKTTVTIAGSSTTAMGLATTLAGYKDQIKFWQEQTTQPQPTPVVPTAPGTSPPGAKPTPPPFPSTGFPPGVVTAPDQSQWKPDGKGGWTAGP